MKIAIILGTRPEIIKLSPIIRECDRQNLDYFILHTGQHYSYNMDQVFFEQLGLSSAKYKLEVGSGTHAEQTAKMLIGIERRLLYEKPQLVLVQGDTNTVLAGVVAAAKLGMQIGHVEAGLRSYDQSMPEEINRIVADHCSNYLFAPTDKAREILLHEGIEDKKVFTVGNTIVDAVFQNLKIGTSHLPIFDQLDIKEGKYILATSHRQENVDDKSRFKGIIDGLVLVQKTLGVPVIYPIHPRAKKQLKSFGLKAENITFVEPVDYLTFLGLESRAMLVLTDSGGIQEETCILKVPCVTLRDNTERPETLAVGSNILAGTNAESILQSAQEILHRERSWANPFGDGQSASKIMNIVQEKLV